MAGPPTSRVFIHVRKQARAVTGTVLKTLEKMGPLSRGEQRPHFSTWLERSN